MGTSNSYSGPGRDTPLVPSWLTSSDPAPRSPAPPPQDLPDAQPPPIPPAPSLPPIPLPAAATRFLTARNNFSRFASSGGTARPSLGRAMSNYVSAATGGSSTAAQRMGASRAAGANLLNFLSGATVNGPREALRRLDLQGLVGRPIEEVFLGLMDYVCEGQDGGTVDEGIAREAFIETITELAENGITDLDALTADQMQTIFELYAAHAIEARICNDIGTRAIILPSDSAQAAIVQAQLLDFVRGSMSDALAKAQINLRLLTRETVLNVVASVYEQAFAILQSMGEAEADKQ